MEITRTQRLLISLYCSLMAISSLHSGKYRLAVVGFSSVNTYNNTVNSVVKAGFLSEDQVPTKPNFNTRVQHVSLQSGNDIAKSLHDVGMIIFDHDEGSILPQDDLGREVGLISKEQILTAHSFEYKGTTLRTFNVLQNKDDKSVKFMMVTFNKVKATGNIYVTTISGKLIEGVHGESGQATHFKALTPEQAMDFYQAKKFWIEHKDDVLEHLQNSQDIVSLN